MVWEIRYNNGAVTRLSNGRIKGHLIFNYISDHVTLVKLEYSAGNVNHAVSITWSWIYDSNYERALPLMI